VRDVGSVTSAVRRWMAGGDSLPGALDKSEQEDLFDSILEEEEEEFEGDGARAGAEPPSRGQQQRQQQPLLHARSVAATAASAAAAAKEETGRRLAAANPESLTSGPSAQLYAAWKDVDADGSNMVRAHASFNRRATAGTLHNICGTH
jgi:hypothetical protein